MLNLKELPAIASSSAIIALTHFSGIQDVLFVMCTCILLTNPLGTFCYTFFPHNSSEERHPMLPSYTWYAMHCFFSEPNLICCLSVTVNDAVAEHQIQLLHISQIENWHEVMYIRYALVSLEHFRSNTYINWSSLCFQLAVLGACRCHGVAEACPCSRTAAASRKQLIQLQQEVDYIYYVCAKYLFFFALKPLSMFMRSLLLVVFISAILYCASSSITKINLS